MDTKVFSKIVMLMLMATVAISTIPSASAECYPREDPCGLRQPPTCSLTPVTGYVGCHVDALTSPCEDGCGAAAFTTGNAIWACNQVINVATGGWCD